MRVSTCAALVLLAGTARAQPSSVVMVRTGAGLAAIDQQHSISDVATVAFTGTDASGLSQLFLAAAPGVFVPVSSNASAGRTYLGASIADDGSVLAARERVSGAPPQFVVRRWNYPGPGSALVGSSVQGDFDSAVGFTDVNSAGLVVFPGLINGSQSTGLFAASQRPVTGTLTPLSVFSGVEALRPKLADSGAVVFRRSSPAPAGQVLVQSAAGGGPESIAGGAFSALGLSPAISPSGRVVAFAGDLTATGAQQLNASQAGITYQDGTSLVCEPLTPGPGVFLALRLDAVGGPLWAVQRVAGVSGNGQLDPGEVRWLDGGGDAGALAAFSLDAGLGVTDATCPDPAVGVAFLADVVQQAGGAASAAVRSLVLARVSLRPLGVPAPGSPEPVFDPARPRVVRSGTLARVLAVGQTVDGLSQSVQDIALYNPINGGRELASWVSLGGSSSALLRSRYTRPFRQMRQDDLAWAADRIVPAGAGAATDTFQRSGCTITALAMVSSWYGFDTDPPKLRDWMLQQRLIVTSSATTQVEQFFVRSFPAGSTCCASARSLPRPAAPPGFDSIAETLRGGTSPVLLWVPSSTRDAARVLAGQGHYVLAFGLAPGAAAQGPLSPADILVADPSIWSNARYQDGVSGRWDRSGVLSRLTLEDYFTRLNAFLAGVADADPPCGPNPPASQWCPPRQRRGLRYDARAWFDAGRFERQVDGGPIEVFFLPAAQRRKAITTFSAAGCAAAALEPRSLVLVASPVEVALIDPATQQRYVSSPQIAQPGDVLLTKVAADFDTSTDDADPSPATDLDFPPYRVEVPPALVGRSIGVQVVGVGTGPYTVSYLPGAGELSVTVPLTGTIAPGQVVSGAFGVSGGACYANCDGSTTTPVLNALDFSCFLARYRAAQALPAAQQQGDYANCDGSTTTPILNALDFSCFLARYRAGCP